MSVPGQNGPSNISCSYSGGEYSAGIGHNVEVYGGKIKAFGNKYGAGTITVYDGKVTARGGENAAGIGSGSLGRGGSVEIFGGTVNAIGGGDADGIIADNIGVYDAQVTSNGTAYDSVHMHHLAEIAAKADEIATLESNISALENEVSGAKSEIEDKNSQIKALSEQLEEAKAEIEKLKNGAGEQEDEVCPKCGKIHSDSFWGKIICFFNRIGNFFRDLFQKIFG